MLRHLVQDVVLGKHIPNATANVKTQRSVVDGLQRLIPVLQTPIGRAAFQTARLEVTVECARSSESSGLIDFLRAMRGAKNLLSEVLRPVVHIPVEPYVR